jgi:hypothetical protein
MANSHWSRLARAFLARALPARALPARALLPVALIAAALIAVALLTAGCTSEPMPPATVFAEGQRHERADRYEEAVYWYRRAARRGHAEAMHRLADVLRTGSFTDASGRPVAYVGRDADEARDWYAQAAHHYRRAAREGQPHAQLHLGELTYHGYGVDVDTAAALQWWTRAAEAGLTEAQYRLGLALFHHERYDEALPHVRRAARSDHASAASLLSFMYQDGYGTPRRLDASRRWLRRAAALGDSSAIWQLRALQSAPAEAPPDTTAR